jgi:hypothetical protein
MEQQPPLAPLKIIGIRKIETDIDTTCHWHKCNLVLIKGSKNCKFIIFMYHHFTMRLYKGFHITYWHQNTELTAWSIQC